MASMMYDKNTFQTLMHLVDSNQDQINEADYIKICNAIKVFHDNINKNFPIHHINIYTNAEALDGLNSSLHIQLYYVTEKIDINNDELFDMQLKLKDLMLHYERRKNKGSKKNIKLLELEIDKITKDVQFHKELQEKYRKDIVVTKNKIANYKELNPTHICEQENKIEGEYYDDDSNEIAQKYIHNANLLLLNAFSKIYVRINSLNWLDSSYSNDTIHDILYKTANDIDVLRNECNDTILS